jgi:recombinational DNA repair protein RecR
LENDENIVYRAAEKDGYLYLSISGQVSEGSGVYRNNITATYKIKGTKIVAWLCESTYASEFAISYTRTIYGIPLEGDISLIDEETLDSLCLE